VIHFGKTVGWYLIDEMLRKSGRIFITTKKKEVNHGVNHADTEAKQKEEKI